KRRIRRVKNSGFDAGQVNIDWFCWRPILAKITTLQEIENHWSLCDILDVHEALDIQQEAEEYANRPKGK
ncbi:MAG: hypothetical protein KAJ55_00705, partial [Anaerolineales bacterium]|nr:hypothetical protein [Anaerolineales bacterium]